MNPSTRTFPARSQTEELSSGLGKRRNFLRRLAPFSSNSNVPKTNPGQQQQQRTNSGDAPRGARTIQRAGSTRATVNAPAPPSDPDSCRRREEALRRCGLVPASSVGLRRSATAPVHTASKKGEKEGGSPETPAEMVKQEWNRRLVPSRCGGQAPHQPEEKSYHQIKEAEHTQQGLEVFSSPHTYERDLATQDEFEPETQPLFCSFSSSPSPPLQTTARPPSLSSSSGRTTSTSSTLSTEEAEASRARCALDPQVYRDDAHLEAEFARMKRTMGVGGGASTNEETARLTQLAFLS